MEALQAVTAHFLAHIVTTAFFGVLYVNFVLWREYVTTLLLAFMISQALYSSKARLLQTMAVLSEEGDARPMLLGAWDLMMKPFKRMHAEGRPVHVMAFMAILNWCIEVFALVGLVFIAFRLSVRLLVATTMVGTALILCGRRVFAFRRVLDDNTLASILVVTTFIASVAFIVLFLGVESFLEGASAGRRVSTWIQSIVDKESDENEWTKNIARITDFAKETATSLASQYNETAWFPAASDAFSNYMEHGTLTARDETCADEPSGAAGSAFLGDFYGLVDHLSDLNISMEHVVNYGGPSGKLIANGVTLLASVGSLLVMIGFKILLFFTCVFYMTSHDDFLERNIGDFLPISQADRKRAVAKLRSALQRVFFLPFKVACLHGVVTLVSFRILQVEFPFFAAFMAVVVSVLPIVPAFIVCWPWALVLVLNGRWAVGVLLAASQHFILSTIDTELCKQGVRDANPYLTSLTSFLGFAVFGAQGVLIGPLIMCLATLMYGSLEFLGNAMISQDGAYEDQPQAKNSCDRPGGTPDAVVRSDSDARAGPSRRDRVLPRSEAMHSCRRRVTLRLAWHTPADDDQRTHQTWRLKFSPSITWEEFVQEVQDVTGVSDVSGVHGSDGARITRVNFIEDGETLSIETGSG